MDAQNTVGRATGRQRARGQGAAGIAPHAPAAEGDHPAVAIGRSRILIRNGSGASDAACRTCSPQVSSPERRSHCKPCSRCRRWWMIGTAALPLHSARRRRCCSCRCCRCCRCLLEAYLLTHDPSFAPCRLTKSLTPIMASDRQAVPLVRVPRCALWACRRRPACGKLLHAKAHTCYFELQAATLYRPCSSGRSSTLIVRRCWAAMPLPCSQPNPRRRRRRGRAWRSCWAPTKRCAAAVC